MRKFDIRNLKVRSVSADQISERLLLINLYATQGITFIIGMLWVIFQGRNAILLFRFPEDYRFAVWAAGLALAVVLLDLLVSRWTPEEAMEDGGINERIFRGRPIWHIVLICAIVSVCEELLFRGAVQSSFGPYWTSILFAAIHVRYLRHWIPTGMVFAISYALGWVYIHAGTLWAPIAAHFLIDLIMGLIIRLRREMKS
ncbi:CPBP family intramembrane glutamic endopeptidase [Cohnella zeiphila]|uniref:CPBP family intramembrane metalloprotease n=1 Tax=Cohnella zeiphila TaxID=2761120 RepID=A0A7X0VZJ0_9BACL|nr:CPBP family intramembrane glutamic endopeptidase [Cohnella zeiphila]MBB6735790.1 CPBP family intramembrane metalloprotease [Cohnella zeiphila]